jgi:hypothetical protein
MFHGRSLDFDRVLSRWGLAAKRGGPVTPPGGPTGITLSNSSITTSDTTVGALAMVGGTPPATFTVISVTGA